MNSRTIAVIDIGKTNVKLALVDDRSLSEIDVITQPNRIVSGPPWPHFDVEKHWRFLLDGLTRFHADHRIDAISITTHGAAIALIREDGELAAPILDYEHEGPDDLAAEYDAIRPPFEETGSPRLGSGLNVGTQLFWQFHTDPGLLDRVHHVVTYPQYWGFRLTGMAATDVTSLGCHTDLWNPFAGRPSTLVARLGIEHVLAPTRKPGEVLGPLAPELAGETGLSPDTPVLCGIHDSNASLLPHLLSREAPFSVVSTGTWVIAMAIGGAETRLDPARDTLVNVNAFGDPIPSARFMGGREHDMLLGDAGSEPTDEDIRQVLADETVLLPAVASDTGPYPKRKAEWIGSEPPRGSGRRAACVGFYLALMTARCLDLIGHRGAIHVEGPFARNACFLDMLAAAAESDVFATASATGTSQGAALLDNLKPTSLPATETRAPQTSDQAALRKYARKWLNLLGE